MASFNLILQQPFAKNQLGAKKPNPRETRIYLFVIHDRNNKVKIKTEYNILPAKWDFKKQRVKHQIAGSVPINTSLDKLVKKVEHEYNRIRADFAEMKFPEIAINLKAFVKDKISPVYNDKNKTFFHAFNEYIDAKRNEVSSLTIRKYETLRKSILEFQPGITFDKLDLTFYDQYLNHLRTRSPKGRQRTRPEGQQNGLLNDTVTKYLKNLKNFLKWSYERNYHTNDIHLQSGFKVERRPKKQQEERQSKNDIVTLRMDELKQFYEFDFTNNPRLEKVRDMFCLGCFTGQRWSDIIAFEKGQLIDEKWKFISYKTGKEITVPLVGYAAPAVDILRKYNFLLPAISSQKFNDYLKEAGRLAELNRPVKIKRYIGNQEILFENPLCEFMSSHMGRRTAVSLLLNVEKMPLHQVRDITGHSDLKTLDKYLDKDENALSESMKQTQGISKQIMKVTHKAKAV
jgi:integrase